MEDETRLRQCLGRLWPHVDADAVALTGGVALGLLRPGLRARLADVDLVVQRMDAVRPSVTRDFLVSHYHAPGPRGTRSFAQLVDPAARLRVDIFPDPAGSVPRAIRRDLAGASRLVVTAADLLAHKRALLTRPVDEKHWRDAVALAEMLGEPTPPVPPSLLPDVYSTDPMRVCERCALGRSPDFPLAEKPAILDVLGYV